MNDLVEQALCCTGFGQNDTHAEPAYSDGRQNPSYNLPYQTLTRDQIYGMVLNPASVAKSSAQWMMASAYHEPDARVASVQREKGIYFWLAVDIDKGNPVLAAVVDAMRAALPGAYFMVYSTSSHGVALGVNKWRVLIPLDNPIIGGALYFCIAHALYEELERQGLELDWKMAQVAQLIYLPNRGEDYEKRPQQYERHVEAGEHFAILDSLKEIAAGYLSAFTKPPNAQPARSGPRSPIAAFNRKHSIEELFVKHGYQQRGKDWRSPLQKTDSYATEIQHHGDGDHWVSLSGSDKLAGLGRETKDGNRTGDAFDLHVHFAHKGDFAAALVDAYQCLKEEDDRRYGPNAAEHGQALWEDMQESLKEMAIEWAEGPKMYDWDFDLPPGLLGELAAYIHSASEAPCKQYAMLSALYLMSGICGRFYYVDDMSVAIFCVIVGATGSGKGQSRGRVQSLTATLFSSTHDDYVNKMFHQEVPPSAAGLRQLLAAPEQRASAAVYLEDADGYIAQMTDALPGSNGDLLRGALTNIWAQSNKTGFVGEVTYSQRKIASFSRPALTFGLDTQLGPFKRMLGTRSATVLGLGSRFIYAIRHGEGKEREDKPVKAVPLKLLEGLRELWSHAQSHNPGLKDVYWEDEEGHRAYGRKLRKRMEKAQKDKGENPAEDILTRTNMNIAKVSALVAIGVNHEKPRITVAIHEWAKKFVMLGYDECLRILNQGEAGAGELVRVAHMKTFLRDYCDASELTRGRWETVKELAALKDVFREQAFIKRFDSNSDFKGTDTGKTTNEIIRATILEMVKLGYLEPVDLSTLVLKRGLKVDPRVKGQFYVLGYTNFEKKR